MISVSAVIGAALTVIATPAGASGPYDSVIAGTGTIGNTGDGGPALSAEIDPDATLAVNAAGDVYFVSLNQIREVSASTGFITTVAGTGVAGFSGDGGPAIDAELHTPKGIAIDSSGNLYITDVVNQRIREVNASTGDISTVVGDGSYGYSGDGGPATSADLGSPEGIAVDSSGDIYFDDTNNHVVREVDHSTGDISTVAGNGTGGYLGDGGPATSAEFDEPWGVAVDSSGNLYISDSADNVVREVDHSTGDISTVAGNGSGGISGDGGPATGAKLSEPTQITLDSSGNLYITDSYFSGIREVNAATAVIETVDDTDDILEYPFGVAVDSSGNVYASDTNFNRIYEISASPIPIGFSPATLAFGGTSVETTSATHTVTVTNTGDSTLTISSDAVSGADGSEFSIVSNGCSGAILGSTDSCSVGVAFTPDALGARSADLTFSDGISSGLHNVYLTGDGQGYESVIAGTGTSGNTGDGGPAVSAEIDPDATLAVNAAGDVYFVSLNQIREISASTGFITTVAGTGVAGFSGDGGPATGAELHTPKGIAIDSFGNLYITDQANQRIREVNASTGDISTVVGDGSYGYSGDGGPATSAELGSPIGIALDSSGDIFFDDTNNDVVREVDHSTGDISTVAGNGTSGYSGDGGPATSAEFAQPWGVAVDSSGNVYISDSGDEVVREVDHSTGDISTVAGNGANGVSGDDGPATGAKLSEPTQIALDSSGNLYITDSFYSGIREVNAATGVIETVDDTEDTLEYPFGVAVDSSGNVYASDPGVNKIDEIFPYGPVLTDGPASGPQRFGCGGGIAPGVGGCVDDVDVATGDFVDSETDASVATYGPDVEFSRTYDAFLAQLEAASSTPGPLGYGWTDNWATSLSLNSAYGTTASGDITFNQENGAEALFVPPVSGSCPTPFVGPGSSGTYCALSRVLGSLSYDSGSSTYTLVEHPKSTYTFDSSGQLTSIADPDGATVSLTHNSPSPGSGECPSGAASCETVTSASGRALTLGWSASGNSGTITSLTDPLGRRTTYAYSSGNLTSVTDPLGNVTSYSYDASNANANLKHDLVTTTDPNGQSGAPDAGDVTTNTYDSSGTVTSRTDPKGRVTAFDRSGINASTLTGITIVTDPDSNETQTTFNEGTVVKNVTGFATASAASSAYDVDASTLLDDSVTDPDNHTTSYTYDTDGNVVTKTNPLGKTWTYAYNSFDEATCATEPMASSPCSALSPPSAITAGTSSITPPSSAPAKYVTYTEYDTDGNEIYQTAGDYAPGAGSASQSRTTYDLYNGQSVTIGSNTDTCGASAPSTELACGSVDPDAVVTQLGYNAAGDLTSKSTPDGNSGGELATTTYGYDTDGEQTSTVAPNGNLSGATAANYTTASTYDDDGNVTSVTKGGASGHTVVPRTTSYTYDPDGNRLTSTQNTSLELVGEASGSNASSSLALSYPKGTLAGDAVVLTTTTSPGSGSETVTTPSGYTLVDSAHTGQTTTYVYTHTVASETSVTVAYSTSDAKVASLAVYSGVDPSSPVDVVDDATTGSGTSVSALALTTTGPGDELVFIGGAGQQGSAATWSAPGSMSSETQVHLSGVSSLLVDGAGPASAGSSGSKTATTSVSGQLAAIFVALVPGTATTATSYDPDDEATVVTDPDDHATLTCYDGDGHVAETVPPVGVVGASLTAGSCPTSYPSDYGDRLATDATTTAYDAQGNKTVVTTPAPSGLSGYETTTSVYDPAGQLTSVSAPPTSNSGGAPNDVTAYTYDAAGELLTTTAGAGTATAATTSSCYDSDGDKTATVAPDGNTSSVATCSGSSPYATSSAYQTAYGIDSLGEVVTQTAPATSAAPSGQVTTATYDPAGNVLTLENPDGVTATKTYTPSDQLADVSFSDSTHDASYTYNANGDRSAMTDASGSSSYTYNPFDELTSTTDGAGNTVDYTHDRLGDTTSVTYPLGGGATWAGTDTVTYGYDPASELTSVTDFNGNTSVVTNTADGRLSALSLGASGDAVDTSYAANDVPSSVTLSDGSTLQEFAYSDVPSGAVASETDTPSSALSPAGYTYDAQSRVTQMTPGSGSPNSYGEDASANLTTLPTRASGTYDDASELTASVLSGTTTDYTYDASGNRNQAAIGGTATVAATYNGASQLTGYDDAAANMTAATYNGDGLRISAASTPTGGGSSTQGFVWDITTSVPELLMDSDSAYLYGPKGSPFEQVDLSTGTITYLVGDALGSVRGVVSSTGTLTDSTSYDAWGNPETSGGVTAETPFGFAGAYTDPSGLAYLIGRYYDPSTGQFLTVDPDVAQTGQPYAYTEDDPVNEVDPMGQTTLGKKVRNGCFAALIALGPCEDSTTKLHQPGHTPETEQTEKKRDKPTTRMPPPKMVTVTPSAALNQPPLQVPASTLRGLGRAGVAITAFGVLGFLVKVIKFAPDVG